MFRPLLTCLLLLLSALQIQVQETRDFVHDISPFLSCFGCNGSACYEKAVLQSVRVQATLARQKTALRGEWKHTPIEFISRRFSCITVVRWITFRRQLFLPTLNPEGAGCRPYRVGKSAQRK